jgi:Cu-processing system permease protein
MSVASRVVGAQLRNVTRSRWIPLYAVFLAGLTELLIQFGGGGTRALLSLINLVLLLIPLVSVVFSTLYVYNAREFIELLLAQPVGRGSVYWGLFGGLFGPLALALLVGVGTPLGLVALREPDVVRPLLLLLAVGVALTAIFTALALCIAVLIDDRAWGFGGALLVWLGCTVLYDGLILLIITLLRNLPLETPVFILTFLNPIDLARVALLLTFDVSALLGYTGTIYQRVLGSSAGLVLAFVVLAGCAAIPLGLGYRWFRRKDF